MSTLFYQKARRHLSRKCPVMKRLIGKVGPCTLTPNPADPFTLLVRCVISQQISTKAAESIYGRLASVVGGPPTPMAKIAKLTEAQFKECGVSGPKQRTLRAVIDHVKANPKLLPGIEKRDNETIHEQLTAIKGIGPWSADMFLIFGLGRPDVLPVGDYGFRAALKVQFQLDELPKPDKAAELSAPWQPYRSIATWYLWRSLENEK
ncbi:MAG: DNA-3-methyladenine glycosylase 2 family protein [Planctomycetaceae bacterium]|nr:DNA-3-methyladenine glycosylase 2 family protein [Planctomycetaceae bacterium]